ncbi:hypothetical protein M8J77_008093 [Diaphorina citri]|nr:hypothetical protein M8J77_008093 [Diaphorina citri]
MAINALSYLLNRSGMGFVIKTPDGTEETLNHLLYIDDLKLYAKNKDQLASLMNTVLKFTTDIKMEFGLDKCAHISIEHGKVIDTETLELMLNDVSIQNLDENQYYKYLGIKQYLNINHSQIKRELTNQYKSRLKKILNTGLKSKHLFMAINTYCVPILTYSFGLIKWSETDVKALDIETRVSLTKNNTHHPKSSKERLYIPRKNGGRGLVNIASQWKTQTTKLREYFQQVKNRSNKIKNMCRADNKYTPLQLNQEYSDIRTTDETKERERNWKSMELHGRFPSEMEKTHAHESTHYLTSGNLYRETEGFITAIQDQVITTKNYRKYILRENLEDKCRMCNSQSETIQHITTGCTVLAGTQYLQRHDKSCNIIHLHLAKKDRHKIQEEPYYK